MVQSDFILPLIWPPKFADLNLIAYEPMRYVDASTAPGSSASGRRIASVQ